MATSTSSMKTRTPALIPAIFTTRSVCLAGSGMTSGSSVAPVTFKQRQCCGLNSISQVQKRKPIGRFRTHSCSTFVIMIAIILMKNLLLILIFQSVSQISLSNKTFSYICIVSDGYHGILCWQLSDFALQGIFRVLIFT